MLLQIHIVVKNNYYVIVMELVDMYALGAYVERRVGSSPTYDTKALVLKDQDFRGSSPLSGTNK